jgi:hypothetical protein
MAHSLLSPSSAHCWTKCPGAVALIEKMPPTDDTSAYAEEGTAAHEQAQRAVESVFRGEPTELTGDETMRSCALGWARMLSKRINRNHLFFWAAERRLDTSAVTRHEGDVGTADFLAITADGVLTIADFKYGMGVEVEAERNLQLSIYALAALREFENQLDIRAVRLVIFQPRISRVEKVFEWDISSLKAFGKEITAAAELAMSLIDKPEALDNLVPGETQCRFCKAKAICPALQAKTRELTLAHFDIVEEPPKKLELPATNEQLARALPWLDSIESWCSSVRAMALARLTQGERIAGFKLVAGRRGNRKWAANAEERICAMRIRRDVLYTKTLISPAKAEAAHEKGLIGPRQWAQIKALMTQAEGKPTVAPESDKREALAMNVKDQFEVIEQ